MFIRRLASITVILFFNLVLCLLYLHSYPFRVRRILNSTVNDTEGDTSENTTAVHSNIKPYHNTTNEVLQKSVVVSSTPELLLPLNFSFTLNPQELCSTKDLKNKGKLSLVILVCSAVPNFKQRQTIRQTWGSVANNSLGYVRLAFLLGTTADDTFQPELERESLKYSDIIQQNFIDSYQNLTLKSIMLLKWVTEHCPDVQYVLKTDDDMYVNLPNLIHSLSKFPVSSKVMYGVLFKRAKPDRNPKSKWYVPKYQFEGETFPDYLSGTGYVMSRDIVPKLLEASATLPFLVMEDVFITGLCASQCHVKRFNIRGFAYWRRPPTGCAFRDAITGHHVPSKDMIKIWKELHRRPLICRLTKKKS